MPLTAKYLDPRFLRMAVWPGVGGVSLLLLSAAVFSLHALDPAWGSFHHDLRFHIAWAAEVDDGSRRLSTRPLLQLLIILGSKVPGVGYVAAAVAALSLAVVAGYAATILVLRRHAGPGWTLGSLTLLAVVLTIASAVYAPMINPYIYSRVGSPNVWHNPTQVLLAPLALASFFASEQWLKKGDPRLWIWALAMLAATTLVKPNFALAFIPAFMIWILLNHRARIAAACGMVAPALAILAAQYLLVFGAAGSGDGAGISLGLIRDPLMRMPLAGLALAFPFAVVAIPEARRHPGLCLAWLLVAVAFLQRMFLVETGPREAHGNWHWGYFIALKVVMTYSAAALAITSRQHMRAVVAWSVLALHGWSGIIYLHRLLSGMGFRG